MNTLFRTCSLLALSCVPVLAVDPPPIKQVRQTSGDTVVQPDWAERLTVTVGPGEEATLRGSTDKTLQAAVDYVARLGGGTVKILAGTYRLRNAVYLASHVRLVGEGEKTVLIKEPSTTTTLAADSDWFDQEVTLSDATGFQVGDGVCLRAEDKASGRKSVIKRTLVARTGSRFKLDKALRENVWRSIGGTVSTLFPILSGELIEDVSIENLVLDGNREHNAELDGNYAGCVFLQDCNRITMRGVHARTYHGDGLSWQICHDVVVEHCISEGHSGLGLHPGVSVGHHDTDNLIVDNTVTGSKDVGILFRPERGADFAGHRNRVEANTLRDNGPDGGAAIDIQGGTQSIHITGNTIEDTRGAAKRSGVREGAETGDIVVEGNTIRGFAQEVEKKVAVARP